MEKAEYNLYKVTYDLWNLPVYVVAENQHKALDKVVPLCELENPNRLNIEFIADVIV